MFFFSFICLFFGLWFLIIRLIGCCYGCYCGINIQYDWIAVVVGVVFAAAASSDAALVVCLFCFAQALQKLLFWYTIKIKTHFSLSFFFFYLATFFSVWEKKAQSGALTHTCAVRFWCCFYHIKFEIFFLLFLLKLLLYLGTCMLVFHFRLINMFHNVLQLISHYYALFMH